MLSDFFDTAFSVMRHSASQDDGGAVTDTTAESSTGNGFLETLKAGERYQFEKNGKFASYRLFCDLDTDVTEKDEIVISGATYKVVSVLPFNLGDDAHKEAYLEI